MRQDYHAYLYRDYSDYRSLLRRDFRYRCAYCLMHEYFLGGEAGCCIDHHHPVQGQYARTDLIAEYSNLYWCCRDRVSIGLQFGKRY